MLDGATPVVVGRAVRSPRTSLGNWIWAIGSGVFACGNDCEGCEVSKSSQASSFDSADCCRDIALGRVVGALRVDTVVFGVLAGPGGG